MLWGGLRKVELEDPWSVQITIRVTRSESRSGAKNNAVCDWNEHAKNYKHNSKNGEILFEWEVVVTSNSGRKNGEDRWRVYWQCKSTTPLIDFEL